jgi:hypothetical protein
MLDDILKTATPYLLAALSAIVWLIRLEGKVKQIERTQETEGERLARAVEKMSETQAKMAEQINDMRVTLASVTGYEKAIVENRKKR